MIMLRGACLCEAVRYEVPDAFTVAFNCHCSKCRRTTGAAFKPMAVLPYAEIRIVGGQDDLLIYGDPAGTADYHCARCGSFLYSYISENSNGHVGMGSLIDPPSIRPSFHIFVGSKAPWYEITDDLPQFAAFPE